MVIIISLFDKYSDHLLEIHHDRQNEHFRCKLAILTLSKRIPTTDICAPVDKLLLPD